MENRETDASVADSLIITSADQVAEVVNIEVNESPSVAFPNYEILLLEDSTNTELPDHVAKMLATNLASRRQTKADLLAALLYIVGLEVGFVPSNVINDTQKPLIRFTWTSSFNIALVQHFSRSVLPDYRNDDIGCYTTQIHLYPYPNRQCMLLAREISDALCITLHDGTYGKSVYLSASRYVLKANAREPIKCFQHLQELAAKLKQNVFGPMRNHILANENENYCGLPGIGIDMLWIIFQYLDVRSLQNVGQTCLNLREKVMAYIEKCPRRIIESSRAPRVI